MSARKKLSLRQVALAGALLATLGATWWASRIDEPATAKPPRSGYATGVRAPAAKSAVALAPLAVPARQPWPAKGAELLGVPPPPTQAPPPEASQPAPPPTAPPLPFRYVGGFEEPGHRFAVLLNGSDVVTVRAGDGIGDDYRVASITPERITFIHLPTRQRQVIEIADYEQQK